MNTPLSQELVKMAKEDMELRSSLASDSSHFNSYHPQMKAVHDRNAKRLDEIVDKFGWPGRSLVSEEATQAAWIILQHAIAHPQLQRKCFPLLVKQVEAGDIPPVEMAMLEDRIRCFEGRPQRFGTQFDWDEHKLMSPLPMDDVNRVEERRKMIGLPPLSQEIEIKRKQTEKSTERPPADYQRYIIEKEEWLKANGWR